MTDLERVLLVLYVAEFGFDEHLGDPTVILEKITGLSPRAVKTALAVAELMGFAKAG